MILKIAIALVSIPPRKGTHVGPASPKERMGFYAIVQTALSYFDLLGREPQRYRPGVVRQNSTYHSQVRPALAHSRTTRLPTVCSMARKLEARLI
jgi:hypothetical protein